MLDGHSDEKEGAHRLKHEVDTHALAMACVFIRQWGGSNTDSAGMVSANRNTGADSGGCAGACNAVGTSARGLSTQTGVLVPGITAVCPSV